MRFRRHYLALPLVLFFAVGCADFSGPQPPLDTKPSFVVNGVLDGDAHPNAGAMAIDVNGNGQFDGVPPDRGCSGVLIARMVFLTAAHCLGGPQPPILRRWVTFDSQVSLDGAFIPVTAVHIHPDFRTSPGDDIGVALLEYAPPGITPVSLPKQKLLDRMAKKGKLEDQEFVVVGYGVTDGPPCSLVVGPFCFFLDGRRRSATSSFAALDAFWLTLDESPGAGSGGACFGDSGAPRFLGDTDLVVALTSRFVPLQPLCQGLSLSARLDIKSARKFLRQFVHHDGDDDDNDDDDDDDDDRDERQD